MCLKDNMPLEGRMGSDAKVEVAGIPEVRAVFCEMQRVKAGEKPPLDEAAASGSVLAIADGSDPAAGPEGVGLATSSGEPREGEVDAGDEEDILMEARGDAADPVASRAKDFAAADRTHISIHHEVEDFFQDSGHPGFRRQAL